MRPLLCLLMLLFVPRPVLGHEEVLREDLRSIDAELVAIAQVVQVEADRGSRGPRLVSILVERELSGESGAAALTFRAPMEHGPGWMVGDHSLFFLTRFEGGWHAAALAAESPRGDVASLETAWRGGPLAAVEEGAPFSLPGLIAGGVCFAGLLALGWLRHGRGVSGAGTGTGAG